MAIQIVIDTTVLVAAATQVLLSSCSGFLLRREQHGQGRPVAVVDRFLDDVAARANRHAIFYLIRPFLIDPGDEVGFSTPGWFSTP